MFISVTWTMIVSCLCSDTISENCVLFQSITVAEWPFLRLMCCESTLFCFVLNLRGVEFQVYGEVVRLCIDIKRTQDIEYSPPCYTAFQMAQGQSAQEGTVSISGSRRPPGEGNGYPLPCSCLGSPRTEEPAGCGPRGHRESDRPERLSTHTPRAYSESLLFTLHMVDGTG